MLAPEALGDQNFNRFTQQFFPAVPKLFFRLEIDQNDAPFLIDNNNTIGGRIYEARKTTPSSTSCRYFPTMMILSAGDRYGPAKTGRGGIAGKSKQLQLS